MDPAKSVHQICRYTFGIAKNRSSNVLIHCGQNWSHHKDVKSGPIMQSKSNIVDETADFVAIHILRKHLFFINHNIFTNFLQIFKAIVFPCVQ